MPAPLRSLLACLLAVACCAAADDPFTAGLRKAVMGGGYVLQVQNTSPASIRITVTALEKTATKVVDSKGMWELGHMEGFKFADQDTAVISANGTTRKFQIKGDRLTAVLETQAERQAWAAQTLRGVLFPAEVMLQASGKLDLNLDNVGEYGSIPQLLLGSCIDRSVVVGLYKLDYTLVSLQPVSAKAWAVTDLGTPPDAEAIALRQQFWIIAAVPKDHAQPVLLVAQDGQVRAKVIAGDNVLGAVAFKGIEPDLADWQIIPK